MAVLCKRGTGSLPVFFYSTKTGGPPVPLLL
jgi:hypothetical protein